MEARPITVHNSGGKQHILLSHLEQRSSSSQDHHQQVPIRKGVMGGGPVIHTSPFISNNGMVGPLHFSPSGFSTDTRFSNVSSCSRNTSTISHSSINVTPWPPTHPFLSGVLQSTSSNPLPEFYDFASPGNGVQVERKCSCAAMPTDDLGKQSDWQEWADQLITSEEALNTNWNELLGDVSLENMEREIGCNKKPSPDNQRQQPQVQLKVTAPSSETGNYGTQASSTSGDVKARIQ
uniref:Uncharacterized protein n=1 Tax=Kalanchoe fedtschenkoi TaxID=63787 RepID=A0A7N0U877_KALFE